MGIERLKVQETPTQEFLRKSKNDKIFKTLFEALFDQENRILVLESKSTITKSAFRTKISGIFTSL